VLGDSSDTISHTSGTGFNVTVANLQQYSHFMYDANANDSDFKSESDNVPCAPGTSGTTMVMADPTPAIHGKEWTVTAINTDTTAAASAVTPLMFYNANSRVFTAGTIPASTGTTPYPSGYTAGATPYAGVSTFICRTGDSFRVKAFCPTASHSATGYYVERVNSAEGN
jgi:hypothetical protein